ncbi:hypothetical protein [Goodfellowiella coeruleoviolacea]|uniref:Uncharacterized protein n=1 Tax=Goodfellowiella coeruleoviolacea TaxID=334858 RepID=A0AAE3GEX9_9PSEU|nr:hypothetical protein [Goodfellowiella coeruleoviolacea]MCP2167021.1 hypothetical protein [Goodfellowiella coeruleoviolacea]
MRLRFGVADEDAFHSTSTDLVDQFHTWLFDRRRYREDARLAGAVFHWKWAHQDGDLGRWRLADVRRCLLEHLPRQLAAGQDPRLDPAGRVPRTVAAVLEFLADQALLTPDSDPGTALTAYPLELADQFETALHAARRTLGPVRLPAEHECRAAAARAPVLAVFARLREFFGVPGRGLVDGQPTPADTARLLALLGLSPGEPGVLDLYLQWAEEAGALVWQQNRSVVAAPDWPPAADPLRAVDRIVAALLAVQPTATRHREPDSALSRFVDQAAPRLLAELLAADPHAADPARAVGVDLDLLAELVTAAALDEFPLLGGQVRRLVPAGVRQLAELLAACGVLTLTGAPPQELARLTPVGRRVAVRLTERLGLRVLVRPAPAEATAGQLADLVGELDPAEWLADVRAWLVGRADRPACQELVTALLRPGRPVLRVLTGLSLVAAVFGELATAQVRLLLGGPHDPVAVLWLTHTSGLDEGELPTDRLALARVDLLGVVLDEQGPDGVVAWLADGRDEPAQIDHLTELWPSTHRRTDEVLAAIAAHHPSRRVATVARALAARRLTRSAEPR